jgi:hypothetical protein
MQKFLPTLGERFLTFSGDLAFFYRRHPQPALKMPPQDTQIISAIFLRLRTTAGLAVIRHKPNQKGRVITDPTLFDQRAELFNFF